MSALALSGHQRVLREGPLFIQQQTWAVGTRQKPASSDDRRTLL